MNKVYIVISQWNNGTKIEGDVMVNVLSNEEKARAELISLAEEAKIVLSASYDNDDITTEGDANTDDVVCIDACNYEDWWEGRIEEKTVE